MNAKQTTAMESGALGSYRRPRRRFLWAFTFMGCALLLLRLGWVHYKWHFDELEFQEAVEEADRLDPGWRLADLEAARAAVPDAENSAFQVLAAHELIPKNWFPPPQDSSECLEYALDELPPQQGLDEKQSRGLACELEKVSEAVLAARHLAEMPRGRYSVVWSNDAIFTPLPHLDAVREVSRLLWLDAVCRAQHGDIDGALASSRAVLNTGRSLGDEPMEVSQWLRISCQHLALKSLERALAQGKASEAALEPIQGLLEDEAKQTVVADRRSWGAGDHEPILRSSKGWRVGPRRSEVASNPTLTRTGRQVGQKEGTCESWSVLEISDRMCRDS